ncbi:hypothetical protein FBEOM_3448 [Fusarium beomiforme]|uniref:Uncharacterized protein n=1 Tax=Fusarium beomiforme TaxID=44412 RepID=A0A9P5APJ9_9HYPO|nr:hypothetical protein FBEOM_3448 [Fusarium beomiforme]
MDSDLGGHNDASALNTTCSMDEKYDELKSHLEEKMEQSFEERGKHIEVLQSTIDGQDGEIAELDEGCFFYFYFYPPLTFNVSFLHHTRRLPGQRLSVLGMEEQHNRLGLTSDDLHFKLWCPELFRYAKPRTSVKIQPGFATRGTERIPSSATYDFSGLYHRKDDRRLHLSYACLLRGSLWGYKGLHDLQVAALCEAFGGLF